ncbi:amidohydrolase [Rhodovastum sp. RN2-1]|uniref:Amidohydrolase n=1 Tax=Limobrevibacterium gyesilva TaxID=2991712 RepID=A0AA41YRT8_9PROT|nr:amidohydrolase [Limobrevibacterium gyesilva]MCW3477163.1 amidohydrolase [Limobrevibacterium gyesilva]
MDKINSYQPELVAIRRDIHAHPEMGLEEVRTAALVAGKLREWGIEVTEGVGGTGVVGTVKGRLPGQRAIGLRADMDALSIPEQTGKPYASTNAGVMHACGHDGHTTMLLGAAKHLAEHRDFSGTVQLIFQPAEEGRGGAAAMLKDGLFERFPCDAVYGMHNMPGIPVGKFSIRKGPYMASASRWQAIFRGNGGHGGASPHLAADLSIVQAHFVLGLQTIVGRNVPPVETAVISVGYIGGGSNLSVNVMPSELVVSGTARCFTYATRDIINARMAELAHTLAKLHGATVEFTIDWGAPAVVNHDEQVDVAVAVASGVVGAEHVEPNAPPITGGEDFAYMLEAKPGAFIFIGNGVNADGSYHAVHTPLYDFNDAIIPLGVAWWVGIVQQELNMGRRRVRLI